MKSGVLPDWRIKELIKEGIIIGADPALVNTSSLDLRVGSKRWKLLGSFLPLPGQRVEDALASRSIVDDYSEKENFYVDYLQQYIMKLVEQLKLPDSISARVFNKSRRGRIGVSLRALTDGTPHFDVIRRGYEGDIYAEISSTAFPLVIYSGQTAIPQIRFYEGDIEPISGSQLELLLKSHPILTDNKGERTYTKTEQDEMIRTGKLAFTANISKSGLLAYVAGRDRRTLDLSKQGFYTPEEYYKEVRSTDGKNSILIIHPGDFALVRSKENIRLPPSVAAEIDEYSPTLGDMKSSYANLINSTHGFDPDGSNTPSCVVFEIRARDQPVIIQDCQKIAVFSLYPMLAEPEGRYMNVRSTDFSDLRSILPSEFKKTEFMEGVK